MIATQGKIEGLRLTNFTCFADLEVSFSEGINVIIGENGLGKTHLLKVLYWFGNSGYEEISSPASPEDVEDNNFSIVNTVDFDRNHSQFMGFPELFGVTDRDQFIRDNLRGPFDIEIKEPKALKSIDSILFIPVYELLSWYNGFIPSYENRESSIDPTYYYLAKALAPLPLRGVKLKEQMELVRELELEINVKVVRKDDSFFIQFNDKAYDAKLVANGINKIAQLIYLVMNGSLTKNSIIFWDEPEAGLNPKYVVLVAKFLQTLAKAGCQIFVATHDYLLSHTLSLAAEYRDVEPETPAMRFHSLYKTPEGTQIESAEILPEIQHNSILDEYARFYKIEEELFYQSMKVKE